MRGDDDLPTPGTIHDLVADAHAAGWDTANERLLREWHTLGLLGSPQRRPLAAGGSGQEPALYSGQQRLLFQYVVRNRVDSLARPKGELFPAHKNSALASLPVYFWLRFGSDWVSTEQVRNALKLSLGPNPKRSARAAQLAATQIVDMLDINGASQAARSRLRNFLADELTRGRKINIERLEPLVAGVVEPRGLAIVRGPVDSGVLVKSHTYGIQARALAARSLDDITDEQLGVARLQYNASRPAYEVWNTQTLPERDPALVKMFDDVAPENELRGVVSAVLLLLGMQLLQTESPTP